MIIITPGELLDTAIAQLRMLAAFLGDQLPEGSDTASLQSANLEIRACEEVLVSLGVLIPKLQRAARDAVLVSPHTTESGSGGDD